MAGHAVLFRNLDLLMLLGRMAGGAGQAKFKGMASMGQSFSLKRSLRGKFNPGFGVTEQGAIPSLDGTLLGQRRGRLPDQAKGWSRFRSATRGERGAERLSSRAEPYRPVSLFFIGIGGVMTSELR